MAAIQGLRNFNEERQERLKIKTINDEIILFTKEEAKAALVKYIDEELHLFSNGISEKQKNEIVDRVNNKLKQIEKSMLEYIDTKFNDITQAIVERTVSSVINTEVDKRLEFKLKKLKESL